MPGKEPIAIVGIGCRFPGGATDPESFWRLLSDGVDAIREIPPDRWNIEAFYDPDPAKPGKTYSRWGGFIADIDKFDCGFFHISPREAAFMDPQQRVALETAWEALEDAGVVLDLVNGSNTGVFLGVADLDWGTIQQSFRDKSLFGTHTCTGRVPCIVANRISYCLNLLGPSFVVDTACSSALLAVHLACRSLWSHECELALAGGVQLLFVPDGFIGFSKASMLSPDGRCKAFAAAANGYVRAEGAGIIVLKALNAALADGDRIYACIRGTAVNQDGLTRGISLPSQTGQSALVRAACRDADIDPRNVRYVEAHGTGTPAGDPIEAAALGAVLGAGRPFDDRCVIGSVKTNIGHLEMAAGAAGIIKTALVLHHGLIPPSLHFDQPNPNIDFDGLKLRVATEVEPLPNGAKPTLAGVNSFGFGGANAHAVLQASPRANKSSTSAADTNAEHAEILVLSARSPEALRALAQSYQRFLAPDGAGAAHSLCDICHAAGARRMHHDHRLAVVGHSKEEMIQNLAAFLAGENNPNLCHAHAASHRPLVFVFSGQGPQWWGMGRELLRDEPVFRDTIARCDALLTEFGANGASAGDGDGIGPLLREFTVEESASRLREVSVTHWGVFSFQLALAELWHAWGIQPDAVLGHSIGELAAAQVAGALSFDDALRVMFHRGRIMEKVLPKGKMLAVALPAREAEELIAGRTACLTIAAVNSPCSVTLSGDAEALEAISGELEERQIFRRFIHTDFPFHSPYLDAGREEFLESIASLKPRAESTAIISTVTGEAATGMDFDAAYWWRNAREPVRFFPAMNGLAATGHDLFLEIGAHPALAGAIHECLRRRGGTGTVLASQRHMEPQRAAMLRALGALFCAGRRVNWAAVFSGSANQFVRLPSYPWQRERCWQECEDVRNSKLGPPGHPLLGRRSRSAVVCWKNFLDLRLLPWLKDHVIHRCVVFPAVGYIEMALSAAREVFGDVPCVIEEAEFQRALPLPDPPERVQAQFTFSVEDAGFAIHTRVGESAQGWRRHAAGQLRHLDAGAPRKQIRPEELWERFGGDEVTAGQFYGWLRQIQFEIGPAFQSVRRLRRADGEVLAELALPEAVAHEAQRYRVHPAFLDGCLQTISATFDYADGDGPREVWMPVRIARLRFHAPLGPRAWMHVQVTKSSPRHRDANVQVFDGDGRLCVEILGARIQPAGGTTASATGLDDLLYILRWQPKPLSPAEPEPNAGEPDSARGTWLLFADEAGAANALAEALRAYGGECVRISPGEIFKCIEPNHFEVCPSSADDVQQVLQDLAGHDASPCRGIIHLWSVDEGVAFPISLQDAQLRGCYSVLALVQALRAANLTIPIWLLTRGAQAVDEKFVDAISVMQAPLLGLGRVIQNEHPALRCRMVDLDPHGGGDDEVRALVAELLHADAEQEIALRDGTRFIQRLARVAHHELPKAKYRPLSAAGHPFHIEAPRTRLLGDVVPRARERTAPGAGEVAIEVRAAGLNFRDVMVALGLYPAEDESENYLGLECAGVIVALGDSVADFNVGDEVIACGRGCLTSHVVTPATLVARKPPNLGWEQAAALPIVFLTACHGLDELAKLSKGERVLIHAATGGVGLAAVQVARLAGAEIFATAGNDEKRGYLRALGIAHVMDSRSLAFADEVMDITNGRGVDVILNSLAGQAIAKGLSILAPGGRFIEIGKRDIFENSRIGLKPFRRNVSFFAFDLPLCAQLYPERNMTVLRRIIGSFETGTFQPLPVTAFPVSRTADAFRHLAQAKHIGKVVLSFEQPDVVLDRATVDGRLKLLADATYLATGGFGGFGIAAAKWLVERGARHLVLVSRSGAASDEARQALHELAAAGAQVIAAQADVSDEAALAGVFADIERNMPPLRGIIHAAMVLDDGIVQRLDAGRFRRVMAPKAEGAWNLHRLTLDKPLDFFVMCSSVAGVMGNAGQGSYAAANAFLDSLAHHRHALGLPALTINWGALTGGGILARHAETAERLTRQGFGALTMSQGCEALEKLLQKHAPQLVVAPVDWRQLAGFSSAVSTHPRYAGILEEGLGESATLGSSGSIHDVLVKSTPVERRRLLDTRMREHLGAVLGIPASRVSMEKPLNELGIDSLMAVELTTRVESDLRISIPIGTLTAAGNLSQLAARLLSDPQLAYPES